MALTPEQLEKVGRLIDKFDRQNKQGLDKRESKSKLQEGRDKPRQKIITPDNNPPEEDTRILKRAPQGRSQPRQKDIQTTKTNARRRPGKKGTQLARTESVNLGNKNKFVGMKFSKSEQDALEEQRKKDKKLYLTSDGQSIPLTERPEEFGGYIEVQCRVCQKYFDEHPDLVYNDPDEGIIYTCNRCSAKG